MKVRRANPACLLPLAMAWFLFGFPITAQSSPAQSGGAFERGLAEFRAGNYASAAALFADAETASPGATDALLYRAKSPHRAGTFLVGVESRVKGEGVNCESVLFMRVRARRSDFRRRLREPAGVSGWGSACRAAPIDMVRREYSKLARGSQRAPCKCAQAVAMADARLSLRMVDAQRRTPEPAGERMRNRLPREGLPRMSSSFFHLPRLLFLYRLAENVTGRRDHP